MSIDYRCGDCGAEGVKLWRPYNSFRVELRCKACALLDQPGKEMTGDQIGWSVPAVPDVEGDAFWGYTSVPQDRIDWWSALPTEVTP